MKTWTNADLDTMDADQLKALQNSIALALRRKTAAERRKAMELIRELAAHHEIDLAGMAASKRRVPYVNPENQFETWSGRGRSPAWVRDKLASGSSLEDLRADST